MENQQLKPLDKKLLAYLYHDSREPTTKIAKKLKISREQVSYRIKKFESEGIIKGHIPLINYNRLGYSIINLILLKFNKQSYAKQFKSQIKESKNRIITVEVLSKYDLGVLLIFKNEQERNNYLSEMLGNHSSEISEYLIIEPYFSEYYPLKFLGNIESKSKVFHEYKLKEYKLDEKEKNILSVLNKDANSKIIDIAKQTNLSAELVVYKLKKLRQENVLLSTRAYFDMEKVGYFYNIVLINFHNFSKQNQEKLREFCKKSPHVDSLMFMTGKPNCYIQIFHQDVLDVHKFLIDLRQTFPNESITTDILPLKNEGEDVNTLPFL
ncbi:MAG: Lrp/AsnC family transcriptional regulator [Nanoarchaeota archaeon]|nr:Lrp/AsnC family transcriptional regulator [Nanoarchaeota archaeon]